MWEAIQAIWQENALWFVAIATRMLVRAAAIILFLVLGAIVVFLAEFLTPPEAINDPNMRSIRALIMDGVRTFSVMGFALFYAVTVALDILQVVRQKP